VCGMGGCGGVGVWWCGGVGDVVGVWVCGCGGVWWYGWVWWCGAVGVWWGVTTHKRVYPKAPLPKSAYTEKHVYPIFRGGCPEIKVRGAIFLGGGATPPTTPLCPFPVPIYA
jgi:hypothetical protein